MSDKTAGPGRPPQHSRFRKGQSGNPKGRPRKPTVEKTVSAFDIIVDKTLTITRNGKQREVTVEEALQHKTYQDAIAGNRAARREILKMIAKREKAIAAKEGSRFPAIEILKEPSVPENANEAMLILDIARRDLSRPHGPDEKYEYFLLEPWAAQMALSRRRGGQKLTEKEIKEIKRCTRDADTLSWPRSAVE